MGWVGGDKNRFIGFARFCDEFGIDRAFKTGDSWVGQSHNPR